MFYIFFIQFRVFPTSTSVDITIYQYGKNVLYFFYNIAMSKTRRIRKISLFTNGGKFPVLTLSYINTALSQSAFRIYKCYIIKLYINTEKNVLYFFYNIAMSKARRIRKISVFTSDGKFPVLTLRYINTALSQSAFRIYKCYIIMIDRCASFLYSSLRINII